MGLGFEVWAILGLGFEVLGHSGIRVCLEPTKLRNSKKLLPTSIVKNMPKPYHFDIFLADRVWGVLWHDFEHFWD